MQMDETNWYDKSKMNMAAVSETAHIYRKLGSDKQ
jgi:hypothetical protein